MAAKNLRKEAMRKIKTMHGGITRVQETFLTISDEYANRSPDFKKQEALFITSTEFLKEFLIGWYEAI